MTTTNKVETIKNIIKADGTKLMSVTFIKKDGTERVMSFNPKTAVGLVGEKASESSKQAIATRKANNPSLISVCDQSLLCKGYPANACWRRINCETVVSVKSGGNTEYFEV